MSWIYAIIGSEHGGPVARRVDESPSHPLVVVRLPGLYLAAGGISDTCLYETDELNGWVVVGLGIEVFEGGARFMDKNHWRRVLSGDTPWTSSLNGHFAAIRWKNQQVECFTDELGQRALYFGKCNTRVCVSTRVDWVSNFTGCADIDFSSLGSKWLTFNQLDYGSCITGISRLGPRGHAIFKHENILKAATTPWLPQFGNDKIDGAVGILTSLLRGGMDQGWQVSLGLSGGIDSRLLLAELLAIDGHRFGVHTFGNNSDPDVIVSSSIADAFGLDREYFDEPLPAVNTCVAMLKEHAAHTCFVEPASSFLKLRYYPALHQRGRLLIDGGFGEIARRQYLNRIAKFGRRALVSRDVSRLFPLLRVERGDVFAPDLIPVMLRGAHDSLEQTLSCLPPAKEIGVENSVDLLAVRTRIPNYGAHEQARLDGEVINFMPLVQPSFLRAVFAAGVRSRSNGRFYRDLIRSGSPQLATFPLVKGGTTYPFGLSTPAAMLWTRMKVKLGKPFVDPSPNQLLSHIKEFVLDTVHSRPVVEWPGYNSAMVQDAAEQYYSKGNVRARMTIDWWVSFELWRSSLRSRVTRSEA